MFEWLEEEINTIKTRRFHVVDGPADDALRAAIEESGAPVPRSYKEFVLRFGNAKLYRQLDYYLAGVLASPREETDRNTGEVFYRFGHRNEASAYFKESLLRGDEETPVFEAHGGRQVRVADGFEAWLTKACNSARRSFTKKQWQAIAKGRPPFTDDEKRIVEARRKFGWRVVGISDTGDLKIEVHNGSDIVLPYLTIGIRGKQRGSDATLEGGAWLPVADLAPGESKTVEMDCYKKWIAREDVEAFEKPDPEPEDRERYWEFRGMES